MTTITTTRANPPLPAAEVLTRARAAVARVDGLEAMLDAHPFSYAYLLRWKLDFTGEGSPPQRNAWFVWDRLDRRATDGSAPEPSFRWMDREDGRQGVLL